MDNKLILKFRGSNLQNIIAVTFTMIILYTQVLSFDYYSSNENSEETLILYEQYPVNLKDGIINENSEMTISTRPFNAQGGSWLDSFKDTTLIDWGFSDKIKLDNEGIQIQVFPLKNDSFTTALWHFNEGTGSTTYDDTINDNDGTLNGATWINGRFGNALSYDGNDYVEVPDNDVLDPGLGDLTIETWVKFGTVSATTKGNMILQKRDVGTGAATFIGYQLYRTSGNRISFIFDDNNYANLTTTNTISDLKWHHIAAVLDRDDISKTKLYIDGSEEKLSYQYEINFASTQQNINTPEPLAFGYNDYDGFPSGDRWFNGTIDDVRISNITRSPPPSQANLTSKSINLPSGMQWDSLIVNKSQPLNTGMEIKILNASNNQQIPGSLKYIDDGEYDISYIDSTKYPSIKLNASLSGNNWGLTPSLNYWGVCWNQSTTWQDTFYGGLKIQNSDKLISTDGDAEIQNNGFLNSTIINIPVEQYYDTLLINKTEPVGGSLKVTILDGQTNNPISGFIDQTGTQIDLSTIDPITHSSIKLQATFTSGGERGTLHDWSLNWTNNIAPNINDISSPLSTKRTTPIMIAVNLTDVEDLEDDLTLNIEYKSPFDALWQTDYLTDPTFNNNRWECIFTPPADADLGEYVFGFSCYDSFQYLDSYSGPYYITVLNNIPEVLDATPSKFMINRSMTLPITMNAYDVEVNEQNLNIVISYKSPNDLNWKSGFIDNLKFSNDHWECTFTPDKTADLGDYTLNVTCDDFDNEVYHEFTIEVINNKPTQPNVEISPADPKTTDDLTILVTNTTDVETSLSKMEYWYFWYRDDYLIPEFENKTTIPSISTSKGEVWRCEVYPFDGDEPGTDGEAETIIRNSPPFIAIPFNTYEFLEDSPVIVEDKLMEVFSDLDNDILTFNALGQKNITVEITQENGTIKLIPMENWFGTELITFYALDSLASTETIVQITVKPTNDLPKITRIGSQSIQESGKVLGFVIDEDKWLNLTVLVEDIDGDVERNMINYFLNITEGDKFYFNDNAKQLCYKPENDDVGLHYINIRITDNNETPTIYISQDIKIEVFNVNDPPTITIISPINNQIFREKDKINLECNADDIDLLISKPTEQLTFRWKTNVTGYSELGTGRNLTNVILPPGYYNVTVEVTDSGKMKAHDSIHIRVKAQPKDDEPTTEIISIYFLFLLILIIAIVLIGILVFVFTTRKKKKMAAIGIPKGQILQPDASYTPPSGVLGSTPETARSPLAPVQPQVQPQVIQSTQMPTTPTPVALAPTPTVTQPQAQLPPVQPTPPQPPQPVPVQEGQQIQSTEPELTTQQKLKMLEERLIRGEISEEIYLNLKDKIEFEARPTQPAPQLPPVQAPSASIPSSDPTLPIPQSPPVQTPAQMDPQTRPTPDIASEQIDPSLEVPPETEIPPNTVESPRSPELPDNAYQPQSIQQPAQPIQQSSISTSTPMQPSQMQQSQVQPQTSPPAQQPSSQQPQQPSPQQSISQPQQTPNSQKPSKDTQEN